MFKKCTLLKGPIQTRFAVHEHQLNFKSNFNLFLENLFLLSDFRSIFSIMDTNKAVIKSGYH